MKKPFYTTPLKISFGAKRHEKTFLHNPSQNIIWRKAP
jgi:hypothetical protein